MFKRTFLSCISALALLSLGGCASVFSSSTQVIEIETNPEDASITITNRSGEVVYQGRTPFKEELKKAKGFFKGEDYAVHIEKGGFRAVDLVLTSHNNGWYVFGNTLNVFLPGWLIADPKTTNMYRLDPEKIIIKMVPLEDQIEPVVSNRSKGTHRNLRRKFK